MHGWIDGDQLVFETVIAAPVRLRMVWDAADPSDITWRDESSVNDTDRTLVEAYHLTPVTGAVTG